MNTRYTLPLDDPKATLEVAGGKGASLARMVAAGLPVPEGFHLTTDAYRRFVTQNGLQAPILEALEHVDLACPDTLVAASQEIARLFRQSPIPTEVANAIVQAYAALPGEAPPVAVRSSATAEDLHEASFAGQQETYLNVSGAEAVLNATRNCWASLWTARAISYRALQGIGTEGVALAVVVQLLVSAEAAGILFTANPINGSRDQLVINASWGLGEAIVGGLVTPDTLTLQKPLGKVIHRETAEKLVQTRRVAGGTREEPVPASLRRIPVISDGQAAELARLGVEIEELYGTPMDIEWTLADGKFSVVQARPITALPEPEPPVPTEWQLPKGAYAAMRNNIVELMTDPLSPLFRTFGLRAVNTSMSRLLYGFFGMNIMPADLIISVNEYAYYNGSVKFVPMMKILLSTRKILKRMFTGAVERWTQGGRGQYLDTVNLWVTREWKTLSSTELLAAAAQLSEAAIDAYGSLVSGVIPAAWMSEAWFTFTYRLVKRKGDPTAPTYLMGFDSLPIRSEKALYDLAQWAAHTSLGTYLQETVTPELSAHLGGTEDPVGVDPGEWQEWQTRFQHYLGVFGHMIYNLDFSNPVPADDPGPVLDTFKLFLSGEGVNPHERQKDSAQRRDEAERAIQARLKKGLRLGIFQKNLARAQKYAPLREDGLADVGLSYPLLRQIFQELGRRLVAKGLIACPEDIYWLESAEVEGAVSRMDQGSPLESLSEKIPTRKAIWRAARRAAPPLALPQMKIFGVDLMELKSGGFKAQKEDTLKGVAASPGTVTAPACVLRGPADFSKMKTGDVLVASLTTPAWTPLFARASAVVTDIGGPLSHGSIVAREYGIPAVLGTGAATTRISTGQIITVDGSSGTVTLSKNGNS